LPHGSRDQATARYGFRTAVRSPPLDEPEEVEPPEADDEADDEAPLLELMLPWLEVAGEKEPPGRAADPFAPAPLV